MQTVKFQLEPLTCPSCIKSIESSLSKVEGVTEVAVLFNSSKVKITYQLGETTVNHLAEVIEQSGYRILEVKGV